MRSIDDNTSVTLAVLRALRVWGPLPESDISRMVKGMMLVTDDLREMSEEGYIELAFIGDEYVATIAQLGRIFLEQDDAGGA